MANAVALFRAVNVGGRNKIGMAALRALFAELGYPGARTYVQSGNVVFASPGLDGVAERIERATAATFGVEVHVVLRSAAELARVAAGHPLSAGGAPASSLHVLFLREDPDPARVAALDVDRSPPDRFEVHGREVYLHYPNGSGRSKLTAGYLERTLGVLGTARNWNTVTRLDAMVATG